MSKYKYYYYLTHLIFSLITITLLFSVIYPILRYYQKKSNPVVMEVVGENVTNSGYRWIMNFLKINLATERGDHVELLVFLDKESLTVENLQKIGGNLVIFEKLFSQISDPEPTFRQLNYLTGVDYSGFSGATYEDLNDRTNIPEKLITLYEATTGAPWKFFGEGIIISNDSSVIVLRQGIDYKDGLRLRSGDLLINFQGAFEITHSSEMALSEFTLDLLPAGKRIFEKANLPASFPAMYKIDRNLYEAYYFAGDFSNFQVDVPYAYSVIASLMKHKMVYSRFSNEQVFWRWYYPLVEKMVAEIEEKVVAGERLVALKSPRKADIFTISGQKIFRTNQNGTTEFFIKGVNLGAALPGHSFTEFPEEKETYLKWFAEMANLNVNTVRLYTLLPPVFYQAFYEFNHNNPKPLYLLQEIWPEEYPLDSDYLKAEYNKTYHQEIEYVVNAVHGNIQIPSRSFRSYGLYSYDISPYLIGYLVGREMEPDEVLETDRLNAGYVFSGDYFYSLPGATPTEAWLAESCDYALSIEDSIYKNRPLIAIVNWPTLDPLEHNSEWNEQGDKTKQYNDKAVVNINNIGVSKEKAIGFFGAYHIYPNYPDFMNNDIAYDEYSDEQGRFRYGGYLQAFIAQHTMYPAVVAEYGISTSSATAHFNPDGYHHGGLSETQQAEGIIRMTEAIVREGYSGAIVFEWINEWAKKTWTTEPYMIPYGRHLFWHNVLDPEQNYGLLSYEATAPVMHLLFSGEESIQGVQMVHVGQNVSYLQIEIKGPAVLDTQDPISVLISTYESGNEPEPLWEFVVRLGSSAQLLVNPGYNWIKGKYISAPADISQYEPLIQLTNKAVVTKEGTVIPEKSLDLSQLHIGPYKNNENQVEYDGDTVRIRLPYGLLAISDPSSRTVLYDMKSFIPVLDDQIGTRATDKVKIAVLQAGVQEIVVEYKLSAWELPQYTQRLKDGFNLIAEYFGQ